MTDASAPSAGDQSRLRLAASDPVDARLGKREPLPLTDLRMMQCFVAVAEESHVSRAAEQLGVDQASVSRAVKRLERELGRELLVRRRGRIGELTEAGEMALAAGKQVLGVYRELIAGLKSLERR